MTIRQQAFSGIRWNALSKGLSALGGIVQLYILVRLLEPADFGLMAMVNIFLFFAMNFLDFGINNGLIHKEEISTTQLSTLYWLNILLGFILALLFFVGSNLVAWFYGEAQLIPLIRVLALVFIFGAIGNQFKILLAKDLQFDALAKINIFSFLAGFLSTVFFASRGYGVWSLVWGSLIKNVLDSFAAVLLGKTIFWPKWIIRLEEVHFFIHFGLFQMGERMLNFFNQQFDVILIGKILGPDILGFYDVIKRFLLRPAELVNPIITGTLFPIMARLQKNDEQLGAIYLKQLRYICLLNFPMLLFLYFNADICIELLFGPLWLDYIRVFKIYLVIAMIYSTGNPVGTLILAKGRADLGFYWNFALFLIIPLSIYWGIYWNLTGVVIALLLVQLLLIIPNYYFLIRPLVPIGWLDYFKAIIQPLFFALLATGVSTLLIQSFMENSLGQLVLIAMTTGLAYLWINWQFNRPFITDLKTLGNL